MPPQPVFTPAPFTIPPTLPKPSIPSAATFPVSSAQSSTEEALCPVCELGLDDVDHSECVSEAKPSGISYNDF